MFLFYRLFLKGFLCALQDGILRPEDAEQQGRAWIVVLVVSERNLRILVGVTVFAAVRAAYIRINGVIAYGQI